jgi:UDP-N-acetylglucosamine:LPS N-acetylglucosamine transferase
LKKGIAVMLEEKDLMWGRLARKIKALVLSRDRLKDLNCQMTKLAILDSSDRICEIIERLADNKSSHEEK